MNNVQAISKHLPIMASDLRNRVRRFVFEIVVLSSKIFMRGGDHHVPVHIFSTV